MVEFTGFCGKCGLSRYNDESKCTMGYSDVECPEMNKSTAKEKPKADGGLRYDANKLRVELLPVEWIWALAEVTTRGSFKYAARNWERGMAWSKMIGCAFRHTLKFILGERYDPETGCHHLAMAAWNILALMVYDVREIGENDMVGSMDWVLKLTNRSLEDVKAEIEAKKQTSL